MLGIIGGSGLAQLNNLAVKRRENVRTPYGDPSDALAFGVLGGREVVFLARHGCSHTIPPHQVNYRANLCALSERGVNSVVAIVSVGGIRSDLTPGMLVVPDQIIDYTHCRAASFFSPGDPDLRHIDFTWPYCAAQRAACLAAARRAMVDLRDGGVYAATQGPRLETAAEINRLERDGADMVGMTGMPEAALARELGLCYAAVAVVANHAAGRGGSTRGIAVNEMPAVLERAMEQVRMVIEKLAEANGD